MRASLYAAAIIGAGFAALLLGSNVLIWFWPYNRGGLWNEAARLLVSLLVAAILLIAFRRYRTLGQGRGFALFGIAASLIYSFAAATDLGWSRDRGFGFAANRFYLFSTSACEFTARFAAPPEHLRFGPEPDNERPVAVLADLDSLASYRADCASAGNRELRLARDSLEQFATAAMRRWAAAIGLQVERQGLDRTTPTVVFKLTGWLNGSVLPGGGSEARRTRVEAWSYIGETSVMTVIVAAPQAAVLPAGGRRFLEDVRRKP